MMRIIDVIISWLDKIAEIGALERYFRPEGHYGDGVGVIPIDVGNKVRLYCLRLSDKILVFGNGGVKDSPTWEESEELAPYVKLLIDTSRFISSRIKNGTIVLVDKEIIGDLYFSRDEEEQNIGGTSQTRESGNERTSSTFVPNS